MTRAWLTRAGKDGAYEQGFLNDKLLILGWSELGDISDCPNRDRLRTRVLRTYPHENASLIGNWTGQLWRFLYEMSEGDLAVVPLKNGKVALGRITGPYVFRADGSPVLGHTRAVDWLRTDVSRQAIRPDLRATLGSLLTVCELSRFDAASRLESLAQEGEDPGSSEEDEAIRELKGPADLAERLRSGESVMMTVRQFIGVWDASSRNAAVLALIRSDLAQFGLSTSPPFTEGSLDTTIEVLSVGSTPETPQSSRDALQYRTLENVEEPQPLTLNLGAIPSAKGGIVTVALDDSLSLAMSRMVVDDLSQLPVVDDANRCLGAVSWKTIGTAYLSSTDPTITDAMDHTARTAGLRDPLLDWVGYISETGYVFAGEADGTLTGIVTTSDVTDRFGQEMRPYTLLKEVERRLRRRVDEVFSSDDLHLYARGIASQNLHKHDTITAGALLVSQYEKLLDDDDRWQRMVWNIDRWVFLTRLADVRERIRNPLMHFHEAFQIDPVSDEDVAAIQGLVDLLRAADPRP